MTTATTPASRTVLANGLRLHALDWGNAGATPLVLLHGLGGSAADWTSAVMVTRTVRPARTRPRPQSPTSRPPWTRSRSIASCSAGTPWAA
jgi:pimeloyl-ACP methyl ester carboxylesterase